jgi:hypothetical protein
VFRKQRGINIIIRGLRVRWFLSESATILTILRNILGRRVIRICHSAGRTLTIAIFSV